MLDKKLQDLREYATFDVNINSVVGGGIKNPEDARTINTRARELGFSTSIGIIHDGSGRLKPLGGSERKVYDDVSAAISGPWQVVKNLYSGIRGFQDNLADGKPNEWRCRAGARYLYVCEEGLVHYCSQQRGYPGVPLESYSIDDIRREFGTQKACAPYCTVGCVHRVSTMDFWRSPQDVAAEPAGPRLPARALGSGLQTGRGLALNPLGCRGEAELRGLFLSAFSSFFVLLPAFRLRPVLLEHVHHLLDHAPVVDDDADLAALFELEAPQALAADERPAAVTDDGAHVKPLARIFFALDLPLRLDLADDAHVDARVDPLRDAGAASHRRSPGGRR